MRHLISAVLLGLLLTACNPQSAPVTSAPTAVMDSTLLPTNPTATAASVLPADSTTPVMKSTATEMPVLQPGTTFDATPTPEMGVGGPVAPENTVTPALPIKPAVTATLASQTVPDVPKATAVVALAEDLISAETWRTVQPAEADQTFSGEDFTGGTLTLNHPAAFIVSGDANGLILSTVPMNGNAPSDFAADETAMYVTIIPNDLAGLAVAAGFEPSPALILANFIASTQPTVTDAAWGQILLTTTADRASALVSGRRESDDALILVSQIEGGYVIVTTVTDQGGLADVLPVVAALAQSLTYTR